MSTIYLDPALVPAALRGSYKGKQFKARVCESVTIPMTAGLWEGGSRKLFSVVTLDDGMRVLPGQHSAPWDQGRRDVTVKLEPNIVVVEHSMFCGKDMGLTFYLHPDNAAKLLPAPVELTPHESIWAAWEAIHHSLRETMRGLADATLARLADAESNIAVSEAAADEIERRKEWERV